MAMIRILTPLGYEFWLDEKGAVWTTTITYARLSGKTLEQILDRCHNQSIEMIDESDVCQWLIEDNPEMARFIIVKGFRDFVASMPVRVEISDNKMTDHVDAVLRYVLRVGGTATAWQIQDSGEFGDLTVPEINSIFLTLHRTGCGVFDNDQTPAKFTAYR